MREVRFDHDRRQLLIPIAIVSPDSPSIMRRSIGLVDTGASYSGITRAIADDLRLPRCGKTIITTPSGEHSTRLYRMSVGLYPSSEASADSSLPYIFPIELVGIECSPGRDFDVLVGMDVIGRCNLLVARDGYGTLSF